MEMESPSQMEACQAWRSDWVLGMNEDSIKGDPNF